MASAKPIDLMIASSCSTKAEKTAVMIAAAAVTTRAELRNPSTIASGVDIPCTRASRMRVTRKTW